MIISTKIYLIEVFPNSWWLDKSSPVHITNSMHIYLRKRAHKKNELSFCIGNDIRVALKAIRVVKLELGLGVVFGLDNICFVPFVK